MHKLPTVMNGDTVLCRVGWMHWMLLDGAKQRKYLSDVHPDDVSFRVGVSSDFWMKSAIQQASYSSYHFTNGYRLGLGAGEGTGSQYLPF
jgi:hypothetical protein